MWVENEPKLKTTELCDFGGSPAISHSVMCWVCDKNPAIYSANPDFIFIPCWDCQKTHEGWWAFEKKKWYQKLLTK